MTLLVIGLYLAGVLSIGFLSHRLFRGTGEDYFVATRTIGPFVLLMSLFGTHMTAFSLLGASGEAHRVGIGVFSLMASSSAIVVPASASAWRAIGAMHSTWARAAISGTTPPKARVASIRRDSSSSQIASVPP